MSSSRRCTRRTTRVLDVTIRPQAQRDLREIWQYTRRTWSREQADRYLAKLNVIITDLSKRPRSGRRASEISAGLFRRSAHRHVIYFRVTPHSVIVVRVLHDGMDAVQHIANDET